MAIEEYLTMFTKLMRGPEVAEILGISKALAYRLVSEGKLKGVKFNRTVRIRPEDLEEFIANNLTPESNTNCDIAHSPIGNRVIL